MQEKRIDFAEIVANPEYVDMQAKLKAGLSGIPAEFLPDACAALIAGAISQSIPAEFLPDACAAFIAGAISHSSDVAEERYAFLSSAIFAIEAVKARIKRT